MQSSTGREMLRQRSEMLNYVTCTASQRGSEEDDREEDGLFGAWRLIVNAQ